MVCRAMRNAMHFYQNSARTGGGDGVGPTKSRPEPSGTARSRPDAARVGRDSNPCMTVPIPSAAPGLSVVTVGWLLELSFKKPSKMRSLMA